jgi:hypothetical protein
MPGVTLGARVCAYPDAGLAANACTCASLNGKIGVGVADSDPYFVIAPARRLSPHSRGTSRSTSPFAIIQDPWLQYTG